jgi:hypothetical protein
MIQRELGANVDVDIHIHILLHTYILIHIHTYIHLHTYTHTHTHTYTHIYTYTHTHIFYAEGARCECGCGRVLRVVSFLHAWRRYIGVVSVYMVYNCVYYCDTFCLLL